MSIKNFVKVVNDISKKEGYTGLKKIIFYIIAPVVALYGHVVGFIQGFVLGVKTTLKILRND